MSAIKVVYFAGWGRAGAIKAALRVGGIPFSSEYLSEFFVGARARAMTAGGVGSCACYSAPCACHARYGFIPTAPPLQPFSSLRASRPRASPSGSCRS